MVQYLSLSLPLEVLVVEDKGEVRNVKKVGRTIK